MLKKVIAARFSKARVIRDLWERHDMLKGLHHFDDRNGTNQLRQSKPSQLIDRAVAYGEWRGIETIIGMIESGQLGYGE